VLVSASTDGGLRAWNVAFNPGQPAPADFGQPVQAYAAGPARDVAFAADGTTFYTSGEDGKARAWRLASPAPTRSFNHPREVDCVGLSLAGTVLATGSHDGNVRLWDMAKGAAIKEIKAHPPAAPAAGQNPTNPVYCLAWLPGANQVVSGGKDGSLKLWDAAAGTLVREFRAYKQKEFDKGHKDAVFCAAVSPDGKVLASGSGGQERVVKLWNVPEGTVLRDFVNPHLKPNPGGGTPSHPGWVYGVRFTPDGKYLVSVGAAPRGQGYLAVWSVADGKLVRALELPVGTLYSVAVSPDGGRIAVAAGLSGGKLQDVNRSYIFPVPGPDK
jgi:WD40 repeat protein